jgi:uncharacterized membrane protein YtjA (UPF0391 family)
MRSLPSDAPQGNEPAMHPVHADRARIKSRSARPVAARTLHVTEKLMLKWAIIFAVVSVLSGWMGFGGVSGVAATISKILFVCFLILFLLAMLAVFGVFSIVL